MRDARQRDLGQLADYITGELESAEAAATRDRLVHDDGFRALATPVLAGMTDATSPALSDAQATDELLARLTVIDREQRPGRDVINERRRRRWLAEPIIALASVAALWVIVVNVRAERALLAVVAGSPADVDIRTVSGEERSIRLPDGSRVTVEPESRLSYRASRVERAQLVVLSGAATFDVVPQGFGTFRVAAGRVFVAVEGTRFSVRAYPGDSVETVIVLRGRALVAGRDGHGVLADSGSVVRVIGANAATVTGTTPGSMAWENGQLRVDGVALATVVDEFRRWYGASIRLADRDLATKVVTVLMPGSERDGVAVLCAAAGARAEWTKDGIVLYDGARHR